MLLALAICMQLSSTATGFTPVQSHSSSCSFFSSIRRLTASAGSITLGA